MAFDLALSYDAASRRCDLALGARDLVLGDGLATPALLGLLSDGRARVDDPLPQPAAPLLEPDILNPRRGWCGDALHRGGRLGSRLWLLERAFRTEATRRRAEAYVLEALAPMGELDVLVEWQDNSRLAFRVRRAGEVVELAQDIT